MKITTNYANYVSMPMKYNRISQQPTTNPQEPAPQPAFKAKQEVIVNGLYKKYPGQAKKILETIKQVPEIADFMSKYVKTVTINARKYSCTNIENTLYMAYKNPYESTWKKIKNFLSNSNNNFIRMDGFGLDISEATENLCQNCKANLHGHVVREQGAIDLLKEAQESKIAKQIQKQQAKTARIQAKNKARAELDETVAHFFEK